MFVTPLGYTLIDFDATAKQWSDDRLTAYSVLLEAVVVAAYGHWGFMYPPQDEQQPDERFDAKVQLAQWRGRAPESYNYTMSNWLAEREHTVLEVIDRFPNSSLGALYFEAASQETHALVFNHLWMPAEVDRPQGQEWTLLGFDAVDRDENSIMLNTGPGPDTPKERARVKVIRSIANQFGLMSHATDADALQGHINGPVYVVEVMVRGLRNPTKLFRRST